MVKGQGVPFASEAQYYDHVGVIRGYIYDTQFEG